MESLIRIDSERLSAIIGSSNPNACLDTESGRLLPKSDCPEDETGHGSRAVKGGKRYIIIPSLDELVEEGIWQARQAEKGAETELRREKLADLRAALESFELRLLELEEKPKELEQEVTLLTGLVANLNASDDPEYVEFCYWNDQTNAEEGCAANWLVSLQLPSRIAWIDTALGGINDNILMVYDPSVGEWEAVS